MIELGSGNRLRYRQAIRSPASRGFLPSTVKSIQSYLSKSPRRTKLHVIVSWGLIVLLLGIYWTQLQYTHTSQLREAESQTYLRASQAAHAMSLQASSLVEQIDYIARHMSEHWLRDDPAEFRRVIVVARNGLPEGALVQVAVADTQGKIVFTDIASAGSKAMSVSIADREHFKVHTRGHPPQLFVSHPLFGRVSERWGIQFSRPVMNNGRFAGVIVISLSPEYLSRALRAIFPDDADTALLLREDGAYLARSHMLNTVLGKSVPPVRNFLGEKHLQQGTYEALAPIDGVRRYYAWHRTSNAELIMVLGLSKDKALATARQSVRNSNIQNAASTVVMLLAALWITGLYLKSQRQTTALIKTGERLGLALNGGNLGTWDWNMATGRARFNRRWGEILGYAPKEVPSTPQEWERLTHPDDLPLVRAAIERYLHGDAAQYEAEYRIRHRNGEWVWLLDRGRTVMHGADGMPLRMAGTALDITARKRAEEAEAESHHRMKTLLQRFPGGVLMEDAQERVVMANQMFCDLLDLPHATNSLEGWSHADLQARLDKQRASWLRAPGEETGSDQRKTIEASGPDGRTLEIDRVPIVQDNHFLGRVWLVRDITQRKQQEARLTALATTDALTGLPNRPSFMRYLDAAIENCQNFAPDRGAVLMLDLDYFKRVNDTWGHAVGDTVLQHTARAISSSLREGDKAGRLGGEEFAVVLPRTSLEEACALVNRLREKLAGTPVVTEKGEISITISIGLAMLGSTSAKESLNQADEALYAAKAAGRNQMQVWQAPSA